MRFLLCGLLLLLLQGSEPWADGAAEYRAGRYPQAFAALAAAAREAAPEPPPELLHDLALAALRVGRFTDAQAAATQMRERGGERFAAAQAFLLGSIGWARSERAEAAARLRDAEPGAWDSAIRGAEQARDGWSAAAASRDDWPAARRNVERALRRIDELRRAQAEQQREMKRTSKSDPEPLPPPDQPEPEPGTEQAPHEPQVAPLPPEQVQRLFDRLLAKEREKLAQREAERSSRPSTVERDW